MRASRPSPYNNGMQKTQVRIKESGDRKPGLVAHVPMAIFTAATVALTILNCNAMAIYFAVMTFLAFLGSQAALQRSDKTEEDK